MKMFRMMKMKLILQGRYEDYKKNPESLLDWNDVKKELFQKYGLGY